MTTVCSRVVVLLLLFGRLWTQFCFLVGCGHDFTVLVVGTCDVALFGCILAMVYDIIVCERKWWNNDDGKR